LSASELSAATIAIMAKRSLGAGGVRDRIVAIALARAGRLPATAFVERRWSVAALVTIPLGRSR
jgi:hypothetical protein